MFQHYPKNGYLDTSENEVNAGQYMNDREETIDRRKTKSELLLPHLLGNYGRGALFYTQWISSYRPKYSVPINTFLRDEFFKCRELGKHSMSC